MTAKSCGSQGFRRGTVELAPNFTNPFLIDKLRVPRTIQTMRTVIETQTFQRQAERIWSEEERLGFIDWIAQNPLAGDVIPGAEGARKVRWVVSGRGKRGGARVIYFNVDARDVILLVAVYAKAEQENISPNAIRKAV